MFFLGFFWYLGRYWLTLNVVLLNWIILILVCHGKFFVDSIWSLIGKLILHDICWSLLIWFNFGCSWLILAQLIFLNILIILILLIFFMIVNILILMTILIIFIILTIMIMLIILNIFFILIILIISIIFSWVIFINI